MAHQKNTGKFTASKAAKILRSGGTSKAAKSAAGSALAQRKTTKVTSATVASKAGKVLAGKSASKTAKSAAGSALSQRHRRKR